jgi:hypothetical protein
LQKIQDIYHNYTAADNNYEGTMSTVFALSYVIENIIHPSKICKIGDVETEMVLLVLLYCKHCELALWRGSPVGLCGSNLSVSLSRCHDYMAARYPL